MGPNASCYDAVTFGNCDLKVVSMDGPTLLQLTSGGSVMATSDVLNQLRATKKVPFSRPTDLYMKSK